MRYRSVRLFMDVLLIIGAVVMLVTAGGSKLAGNISAHLSHAISCVTYSLPAAQRWDGIYLVNGVAENAARIAACQTTKMSLSITSHAGWRRGIIAR